MVMDFKAILDLPFVQVALPVIITFVLATISHNKRIDDLRQDMNRQFDEVNRKLGRIETKARVLRFAPHCP